MRSEDEIMISGSSRRACYSLVLSEIPKGVTSEYSEKERGEEVGDAGGGVGRLR